jgi:ribonuclease P protein component
VPRELTFPKARRLIRSAEFGHVRAQGNAARGNLITLAVAPAPDSESPARIGIIASRKVGAAVIRNRARRRVRDIFRKHQSAIKNGVWLVTIVSARAARASYEQLEDDWLRLARRASILTP